MTFLPGPDPHYTLKYYLKRALGTKADSIYLGFCSLARVMRKGTG